MPTTRSAAKRSQPEKAPRAKKAKRQAQPEDAALPQRKKGPTIPSEEERKHVSQSLKAPEIYQSSDWKELGELVTAQFRLRPALGRLEVPFNFHVRQTAIRIPPAVTTKCLAPLTQLTRLSFSGYGVGMKDSDPLPSGVQLPALKIAHLDSAKTTAESLASFMPNLQQLHVDILRIYAGPDSSHPVLPKLTHLAAQHVWVFKPSSALATAQAFAAAFPALRVLSDAPGVTGFPADRSGFISDRRYYVYNYPIHFQHLTAIRQGRHDGLWEKLGYCRPDTYEADTRRHDVGVRGLQGLTSLKELMLTDLKYTDMPYVVHVSKLQQLTSLSFSLDTKTISDRVLQLLRSAAQLPQLQSLALPVQVLCREGCCPAGTWEVLQTLAAKPSMRRLVFLDVKNFPLFSIASYSNQECEHAGSCAEAAQQLGEAANNKRRQQEHPEVQVVQVPVETLHDLTSVYEHEWDWGHRVWGVCGPHHRLYTLLEW